MTAITLIHAFFTARLSRLLTDKERGSVTLQEVLWTAFWIVAALAAVAVIGGVVTSYVGKIHI